MSRPPESAANAAQIDYWNAAVGRTWAELQEDLDRQIEPLGREALRALGINAGESVVDIGCGCGQTSLDLAVSVGASGRVLGVDVSVPMLEIARRRRRPEAGGRVDFQVADAQSGDLGHALFDAAFSRFGVMFFSDPVAAFSNIRESLKPGGRLGFVCWRALAENTWMRAPLEAAAPFLPPSPVAQPNAPGPFAFADPDRLRNILEQAGFVAICIDRFDTRIGGGNPERALQLAFRVGPLAAAMREHPQLQSRVTGTVRATLAQYATAEGVFMPAAVWIVRAGAGTS